MGYLFRRLVSLALLSYLALSTPARAWEQDVHYLLTFWLADRAGFSRGDADRIAEGNQSYDDSSHAGAIPTVVLIALTADEGAARSVRDKHFPSDAPLPSPPQRRVVSPNSSSARRAIKAALAERGSEPDLFTLGEALHPFQDSWAHQGVPGTPLGLRPGLSFGHPDSRGGWWRHDADYTHLHIDEVVAVAEETYKILKQVLRQHRRLRQRESVPWEKLQPAVRAFAAASNKAEKDAWFTKHLPDDTARLSPKVADVATMVLPTEVRSQLGFDSGAEGAPSQLVAAAQLLMDAWFMQQDIPSASKLIDNASLLDQFRDTPGVRDHDWTRIWAAKLMATQLAADHSAVNDAGHVDPNHPRYGELPVVAQSEGPFRASAPVRVSVRAEDFFRASGPGSELKSGEFGLIISTQPSTPDQIALVWRQFSDGWRVVRIFVAPA